MVGLDVVLFLFFRVSCFYILPAQAELVLPLPSGEVAAKPSERARYYYFLWDADFTPVRLKPARLLLLPVVAKVSKNTLLSAIRPQWR